MKVHLMLAVIYLVALGCKPMSDSKNETKNAGDVAAQEGAGKEHLKSIDLTQYRCAKDKSSLGSFSISALEEAYYITEDALAEAEMLQTQALSFDEKTKTFSKEAGNGKFFFLPFNSDSGLKAKVVSCFNKELGRDLVDVYLQDRDNGSQQKLLAKLNADFKSMGGELILGTLDKNQLKSRADLLSFFTNSTDKEPAIIRLEGNTIISLDKELNPGADPSQAGFNYQLLVRNEQLILKKIELSAIDKKQDDLTGKKKPANAKLGLRRYVYPRSYNRSSAGVRCGVRDNYSYETRYRGYGGGINMGNDMLLGRGYSTQDCANRYYNKILQYCTNRTYFWYSDNSCRCG